MDKKFSIDIGGRIKELREEKGYTQIAFAKTLNRSRSWMSRIESNQLSPSLNDIEEMAKVLLVDVETFVNREAFPLNHEVEFIKFLLSNFTMIKMLKNFFDDDDSFVINPEESVVSLLASSSNFPILRIPENVIQLIKELADIENSKQKLKSSEYNERIADALVTFHKAKASLPGQKNKQTFPKNSKEHIYCIATLEQINRAIDEATSKQGQFSRLISEMSEMIE